MMNQDIFLSAEDLARRWGIHKATVLRLFHSGILLGVALCRGKRQLTTVRFRLASVEAFERARERENVKADRVTVEARTGQ